MRSSVRFSEALLPIFGRNWKLFLLWGVVLTILGLVALSASVFTTIVTIVLLGFLLLFSGIIIGVDALTYWRATWQSFLIHLLIAILYIIVGLMFVFNPLSSSVYLTLWLGILFVIIGTLRIVFSTAARSPQWIWSIINGLITLALGIVILAQWPESSLIIIGILVGVDLLFSGINYIMLAFAARGLNKSV